jgi:hypothetical protein
MHTIRLRGPWNLEPIARFVPQADGTYRPEPENLPPPARLTMPADWAGVFGAVFLGRVRYRRVFQKPTGLDEGQRVFLAVESPRSEGSVSLFGELVGFVRSHDDVKRFEITGRLEDHNRLEILVDHPALDTSRGTLMGNSEQLLPGGLIGEVRLEIEE